MVKTRTGWIDTRCGVNDATLLFGSGLSLLVGECATLHRVQAKTGRRSMVFLLYGVARESNLKWMRLPKEVAIQVIVLLDIRSIFLCCAVSKSWCIFFSTPSLWETLREVRNLDLFIEGLPVGSSIASAVRIAHNPVIRNSVQVRWNSGIYSDRACIKVVVVGDSGIGKTTFMKCFLDETYRDGLFVKNITLTRTDHSLSAHFWDCFGGLEFDRLRPLSYPPSDLFLIAYSVSDRKSFDNVLSRWLPELNHHIPGCPYILVAMRVDRRAFFPDSVTTEEGMQMASRISSVGYFEVSGSPLVFGSKQLLEFCGKLSVKSHDVGENRKCLVM
eukprot:TRINITY_DN1940_c0_g2_i12.p1 TRINITY_DN1940_c0_g2~~TRINITY_DN1940_c0_g2_i12.p1  ORF type:complete len:330 (+),score=29.00 TRINITY_DN1940_c0_g2_i12:348-1337(+)